MNIRFTENSVKISLLRKLVKILYNDISYEIINYIINQHGKECEEQKLAEDLNLSYTQVRQSLILMEKHGILLSNEHKRKRNEEEEEKINPYGINYKKNKTSDWKLNDTFYNVMKNRFSDLKEKLERNLKDKETLKFECSKCKLIYQLEKAAHIGYHCSRCDDHPKLTEKIPEDVNIMRKKCHEVLILIQEAFIICDKTPDFQLSQNKPKQIKTERKKQINFQVLQEKEKNINPKRIDMMNSMINQEGYIIESLEDPYVDDILLTIKKDQIKVKKFKEFVEFFTLK